MRCGPVALLVFVAACSGGSTATGPPSSLPAPTVTSAAPTTTRASSTTVPTSTSTTLPDGIELTYAEPGSPEAEVEIAYWTMRRELFRSVSELEVTERFAAVAEPDLLERVRASVADLKDHGHTVRGGSGLYSETIVSIVPGPDGSYVVRGCVVDDTVRYDVTSGAVVDDSVVTAVTDHRAVKRSGWRFLLGEGISEQGGEADCAV